MRAHCRCRWLFLLVVSRSVLCLVRVLILATDGLWDVMNPDVAVIRALDARRTGRDPAPDLVEFALQEHDRLGTTDNVTCVVVFLD